MTVAKDTKSLLNFLILLGSIPIMAAGLWLGLRHADGGINAIFRWTLVCVGIMILLISLAGIWGANRSERDFSTFCLFCNCCCIVLLFLLVIVALINSQPDGSYRVPGKGYKEYRLDGYSSSLRHHVVDSKRWTGIKSSLTHSQMCAKLTKQFTTADPFFASHLSPLQSGCCKPPTICGYKFVNPTMWTNASNPTGEPDCKLWSNDQTKLCYDCDSCKAGLLGELRKEWMRAGVFIILVLATQIFVSIIVIICDVTRFYSF